MARFRKIVSSVKLRSSSPLARLNSHSRHNVYVIASETLLILLAGNSPSFFELGHSYLCFKDKLKNYLF